MSALDTLKKQAAAVVDGPKAAKVAELLRQAAALLEEAQPKKESFAIVKARNIDARAARLEKFGEAALANQIEKRDQLLKEHGFTLLSYDDKERTYCKPNTPFRLQVKEGKFSMWK